MNVYYCNHDGLVLSGNSVIVAKDRKQARKLLNEELAELGLGAYTGDFEMLDITKANAIILDNGDY